jgi:hypothetical protein
MSKVTPATRRLERDRFNWEQESSRFFEKKRRKKLLFGWACGGVTSTAQLKKSFFASFCSQKEAFLFAQKPRPRP